MRGVESGDEELVVHFDDQEPGLLAGLADQLAELLNDDELWGSAGPTSRTAAHDNSGAGADEPFALWEAEMAQSADLAHETSGDGPGEFDPVVARLFPDAYRDDPEASREFRRFTAAAERDSKVADACTVLRDLQSSDRRGRCRVPRGHATAWLKTLTNLRLSLAARLEIVDEISADEAAGLPESDPRSWMYEVYSWLGWLQESLIEAL